MSDEVIVRFKWTADELRTGMKCHYRAQYSQFVRVLFWSSLYGATIFGAIATFHSGTESSGFSALMYGLCAIVLLRFVVPGTLRRQFSKRPDHNSEIEWRISDEGIKTKTNHSNAEQSWAAFAKVIQTKDGFLFYPTLRIFHWLPRSGFASDADFDRLSQLAQKNAGCYKAAQ
jgi:hypothetical protein